MRLVPQVSKLFAAACVLAIASTAFAADDGAWTVSKSSGEVWLTGTGAQPASLKQEELLKPGDTVRTGRNGRVLLRRGEETMLISPNSVVGMPAEAKEGLSTTIVQQAGSVLLEVEKRNVKHFEVETPYLAAVVKGTQFRVTINAGSTSVDVIRGQVEVADFRSGQIAQVMPGQHATAFMQGKPGLSLSGTGSFNPIEQGKPRAPSIERIPVPRAGLTAPHAVVSGQASQSGNDVRTQARKTSEIAPHRALDGSAARGVIRISSAIGEVKLNIHKVTHGLAQDSSPVHGGKRDASSKDTIWGPSNPGTSQGTTSAGTAVYLSNPNTGAAAAGIIGRSSNDTGSSAGANGNSNSNSNARNSNGSANANNGAGTSSGNDGNDNGNSSNGSGKSGSSNSGNGNSGNSSANGNSGNGNGGNGNGNGRSGNSNGGNGNGGANGNSGNNNGNGNSGSSNGNSGNGNGSVNGNNGNGRGRG